MKCELLSWGEAGPKPPINSKRHRGILFHHHQPLLTSLSPQGSPSKSQQTLNPGGKPSLHTSLFLATMKVNRKMPFSPHHHANFPVLFVQAKRFSKLIFKFLFFYIFKTPSLLLETFPLPGHCAASGLSFPVWQSWGYRVVSFPVVPQMWAVPHSLWMFFGQQGSQHRGFIHFLLVQCSAATCRSSGEGHFHRTASMKHSTVCPGEELQMKWV